MTISLDLLKHSEKLVRKKEEGKLKFFDPIRKKYIVATPEESVRQLLTIHLLEEIKYPKNRISVEKLLIINDLRKRFDLLVYDKSSNPFLVVECKAPNIPITNDVFRQVSIYNIALNAPFLLVTNGQESYCCAINFEEKNYSFLESLPLFME